MLLQSQTELLETLRRLLSPPAGEDFTAFLVEALKQELKASAVLIGEIPPGQQELGWLAAAPDLPANPTLSLVDSPLSPLLDGQSVTAPALQPEHGIEMTGQNPGNVVGVPLIDPYGQSAGAILVFLGEDRQDAGETEIVISILSVLAPRIAEEMERQQAEELILQATEEIDHFSTSLKEIHRLNNTDYESLEELFEDYIQTGCQLFGVDGGLILESQDTGLEPTYSYQENAQALEQSRVLSSRVLDDNATVSLHSEELQGGLSFWIGTPLDYQDERPGLIVFFAGQDVNFELFHQEILELMARSVASEVQRRRALKRIQELKLIQDGDYFLTSLLIRPLSRPDFHTENFSIECVARQKKAFSFRHWHEELGGDLATAYSLELSGRPCVVLFNADAMGKSMQGAGGALVCGSVFTSIIKRTRKNPVLKSYSPERWLKHAFLELNDVFHAFDSSMLISVNLGIVDEQSGTFYYIVAEHPLPVLLRGGRARFLPDPYHYRKLGFQDPGSEIVITVQPLRPGDMIIMGSDGRDDILIPDASGGSYMNEDEHLFLRLVEEVNGDPDALTAALNARGNLTDDLSLIHLQCLAHSIPDAPRRALDLQEKAAHAYREGRYAESFDNAREALRLNPALSGSLKTGSFAAKMCGQLKESADLGERLLLRSPALFSNLIHLSNVHYLLNNLKRARDLFLRAREQKPQDPGALRMESLLKKKEALLTG